MREILEVIAGMSTAVNQVSFATRFELVARV